MAIAPARPARASQPATPLVHLPADAASHNGAPIEWWYVVGHLRSAAHTFGYEVTIFKFNHVRPPGFSTPLSLYRTDVAITDLAGRRFHQRVTYYFPTSASLSTSRLDERVGKARLSGSSPRTMSVAASLPGGAIQLSLDSLRPTMYVGGRGYLSFGTGYTYYYSLTDLRTTGSLTVGKKAYRVTGVSWLDHQWGNWSWTSVRGWTWMALQLSNGVQLSVFDVRAAGQRVRAASILTPGGTTLTDRRMTIAASGAWRSPHTRGVYPARWTVRIPTQRAVLNVTPALPDQELYVPNEPRGSYWEGTGTVSGTWQGRRVSGLSYTELTGFAPA